MHSVEIRKEIRERVLARRGKLHLYDKLDPKKTALLVIDMQNAFVAPGAPVEVPAAREIVPSINRLAAELRKRGVPVIWVLHENQPGGSDWDGFFGAFVSDRTKAAGALTAGSPMQTLWRDLDVARNDLRIAKTRYSAFIKSDFQKKLQEKGIDTLLI